MHVYSSLLDPYEPPRPRAVYDNSQVVKRRRSLLSNLFGGLKNGEVAEPVAAEPCRRSCSNQAAVPLPNSRTT
jgi:hypothetical protein